MINNNYKKIGLVVAMDKEIIPFLNNLKATKNEISVANYKIINFSVNDKEIYLIKSGIGEIYASMATQLLITKFGVELVLNFGVSGSLDEQIGLLSTVFIKGVVHYDFDLSQIDDVKVGQYPGYDSPIISVENDFYSKVVEKYTNIKRVICASADKFVADEKIKDYLNKTFNASVCDMECAGVLLACKNNNVPAFIIKSISDGKGGAEEFNKRVKEASTVYLGIIKDILNI
jgi:adenosylhomocysteine nucleosidase